MVRLRNSSDTPCPADEQKIDIQSLRGRRAASEPIISKASASEKSTSKDGAKQARDVFLSGDGAHSFPKVATNLRLRIALPEVRKFAVPAGVDDLRQRMWRLIHLSDDLDAQAQVEWVDLDVLRRNLEDRPVQNSEEQSLRTSIEVHQAVLNQFREGLRDVTATISMAFNYTYHLEHCDHREQTNNFFRSRVEWFLEESEEMKNNLQITSNLLDNGQDISSSTLLDWTEISTAALSALQEVISLYKSLCFLESLDRNFNK